jgi:hypothetical protein
LLQCVTPAYAKGKGPVGIWIASERYALVADTSLPGLVLVDLDTGAAVERLKMDSARPVGVASCESCTFALIVGGRSDSGVKPNVWRLHFKDTVARLLEADGQLGLGEARLEMLALSPGGKKLEDGRMCLVSEDGQTAYIASSADRALVRVELGRNPTSKFLLQHKKAKPFGLHWDRDGNLLLTMHKNQIWRMTIDGEVLATYDTKKAGCPGENELKPNLRAAVDDPVNANSLLILASNPRSYDAVVWRLSVDAKGQQSCEAVAGKIGIDSGWVDASGEDIEFSRPHFFALRPARTPPQLVITDIDNRALRLLDLTTYATSSVMYDRDRLVRALPPEERLSMASCAELNWPVSISATGDSTCIRQPPAEAEDMTLAQAAEACHAIGARLCEPAELLSTELARDTQAWTAAECASCWQRSERETCVITEEDHKTPGKVHSHADFSQSWRSGQALVVGSAGGAVTLCRPFADNLEAAAPCCADMSPQPGEGND